MSHATVLVIGSEPLADQLDPFWELDLSGEEAKNDPRSTFKLVVTSDEANKERLKYAEDHQEYQNVSDAAFMKDYHHYSYDEEHDGYGYYVNENQRWDWWKVGGRWTGFFKAKPGKIGLLGESGVFNNEAKEGYYDVMLKGDIDWEGMKKDALASVEQEWKEHQEYLGKENIRETKEEFIKRMTSVCTFAVIKDGIWYEEGELGWWGTVNNKKSLGVWEEEWEKLVMSLPDNTLLTVVDYHI